MLDSALDTSNMTNTNPVTVAYAEDHTAVRISIVNYLHDIGGVQVIIQAANGTELINVINESDIQPDICMLDIKMPEMDGFELLAHIKREWPTMKTLVLSTFTEELYVIKMIRAGVNGYLTKDCDPQEIIDALLAIKNNGVYYSELFASKIEMALHNKDVAIPELSAKEVQFLKWCCSDYTYNQIAKYMKTTPKSIEGIRDSLFKKLKVNSRVMLALFAARSGVTPTESGPFIN
jgi:two-component system invasion response regulator UvrY